MHFGDATVFETHVNACVRRSRSEFAFSSKAFGAGARAERFGSYVFILNQSVRRVQYKPNQSKAVGLCLPNATAA